MIDLKRVKCRNGKIPTELHRFETVDDGFHSIAGVADGSIKRWTKTGRMFFGELECEWDLIPIIEKHVMWTAVRKDQYDEFIIATEMFGSREDAEEWIHQQHRHFPKQVDCILARVEFEA